MPKKKTKNSVAKRFKITKTGKVLHRSQGARHLRRNKNKSRQRRQDSLKEITNSPFIRMVKETLGV